MRDSSEANAKVGPGATQGLAEAQPEPDGCTAARDAAEAIADRPRLRRALLFAHQADPHGLCLTCPGVRWPCGPRLLAERAQHLHDGAQHDRD